MKNIKRFVYTFGKPEKIDWSLLVFLLLFLNVKLVFKLAAILLAFILHPDFKFGFRAKNSRLPLFYLLITGITLFNWLISGMIVNFNYDLVLLTGIFFWILCILAAHQIKLAVERNDPEIIQRTIVVFFILNAIVSLAVYIGIILETGALNPYMYQGNYQKYFIGTGDYIKGLTFDTSTTNAVLNAFGVIYFLHAGRNAMVILCMMLLLLTGSNLTNLLLCVTLIFVFFFRSSKDQKSIILICFLMLVTFLSKVSPQNNKYVERIYYKIFNQKIESDKPVYAALTVTQRPDSVLSFEEKREKIAQLYVDSVNLSQPKKEKTEPSMLLVNMIVTSYNAKPVIPVPSIHTAPFQHKNDTNVIKKELIEFIKYNEPKVISEVKIKAGHSLPGKLVAWQQTLAYLKEHPGKIITGTGIGNFSSKLAFRSTALNIAGGYPSQYAYINNDFKVNHLALYLSYFTSPDELHSIGNSPNSTYNQLLSEYGIAGLGAFVFFYAGFFLRQFKKMSYAIPMLMFMTVIFFVDYWFEQLSVVVFFELFLMLNIKEYDTNRSNV